MKNLANSKPIIFEIILCIFAFVLSAVLMLLVQSSTVDADMSSAIGRIAVGIVLFVLFIKYFKPGKCFSGFLIMLPVLLLGLYKIPYQFVSGGGQLGQIGIRALCLALAPAILEEILFREIFITNLLRRYKHKIVALIISSVFFALVHLTNAIGMDLTTVLIQVVFALVVGLVLGAIYLRTEDLISVIIAHFAIDFLGQIFPGGNTTPYWFLGAFAVLLAVEAIYALVLVFKPVKGE